MKNMKLLLALLTALMMPPSADAEDFDEKLSLDLKTAEHSILASLISHRSTNSRYLCTENPYACFGVDGAELGLSLIGGSRARLAPKSLVELTRFRFDAGLSSDFHCYIVSRRLELTRWIESADTARLSSQCQDELKAINARARGKHDAEPDDICRTPSEIAMELREMKKLASHSAGCD